ncbi:MAG: glycine zipper family protein [Nitrosomonas sp.]|nr:glycine zipper family protein [Nitrosomonas sp.]
MVKLSKIFALSTTLSLAACISIPTGPSVMVLPGSGKDFAQFRHDDQLCRHYAYTQVGGKLPGEAARTSGVESTAVGTGLGAIAGTAIGGGQGAAIGAGTGLLAGSLAGTESASTSGFIAQQRYDIHYIQCMYVQGHRVPVAGAVTGNPDIAQDSINIAEPPLGFTPPPPPPGNPPPPPPQ